MPNLTEISYIDVVGATYLDLVTELDERDISSIGDVQIFTEAKVRLGGTGYNQANIFASTAHRIAQFRLITLLGPDPISGIIKSMVLTQSQFMATQFLETEQVQSLPVINIIHARCDQGSRRVMIGPEQRPISNIWAKLAEIAGPSVRKEDNALIFDGYALTSFSITFARRLGEFTSQYSSSTLLLLPHKIFALISVETFLSALSCFNNLESSFYTVSRILFGVGDIGSPSDEFILRTVKTIAELAPDCELNLRYGELDAEYSVNYRPGDGFVTIRRYEIAGFGRRSVGDQVQILEMISPEKLPVLDSREIPMHSLVRK